MPISPKKTRRKTKKTRREKITLFLIGGDVAGNTDEKEKRI